MNRLMNILKALSLIILLCTSCICIGIEECPGDYTNYFGKFRFLSQVGKQDILFGANPVYDVKNIKFFSIDKQDTILFKHSIQIYKSIADSLIEVTFVPKVTTPIYISFAPNEIDTLSVFYQTVERDCCSDYDEIIKYKFNNVEYLYNNEAISFLK